MRGMRPVITLLLAALVGAGGVACSDEGDQPTASPSASETETPTRTPSPSATRTATPSSTPIPTPTPTAVAKPKLTPRVAGTIATGLQTPWDVVFLPDGTALVSDRDSGRLNRIGTDGRVSRAGTVPGVSHRNEAGFLGLSLSPSYEKDRLLYAYISTASDNRVIRMRYDGSGLGAPKVVLSGIPRSSEGRHNGGRLRFGRDGYLYVSTGDGQTSSRAQDKQSLGGKILRITVGGKPAPGNPFGNEVWSFGHRNVEGLLFDAAGRLWASEFGDKGADELNLIKRGGNYGWPAIEGKGGTSRGFVDPVETWDIEDCSPSGIAMTDGAIWMAALRGQRLWRIRVSGTRAVGEPKAYFTKKYGRLRTIANAPDGSLWLFTNNTDGRIEPRSGDDRILRLTLS
ncbi:PQQ-dependent sugar dehydrogenase [Flindersiella endophytica]